MTPYEILGVKDDASDKEIKKAFKHQANVHHPDKEGGDDESFHRALTAYNMIKTADDRAYFEKHGCQQQPAVDEVAGKIAELFGQIINNEDWSGNVVTKAINIVEEALENQRMMITNCENKSKIFHNQLGRVSVTDGPNLYEGVLLQKIEHNNINITQLSDNITLMEKVLKGLDSYGDDCVQPEYQTTSTAYADSRF